LDLTPEEYFYFIGDLRGQNKADVDALLATHEFSTAKSKNKNIYAICQRKPEKWDCHFNQESKLLF
jgi:hypothetical protein